MRLYDAKDNRVPVVTNLCHDLALAIEAEQKARAELELAVKRRTRIEEDIKRYVGYIECSPAHATDTFESGYWEGGRT